MTPMRNSPEPTSEKIMYRTAASRGRPPSRAASRQQEAMVSTSMNT